MQYFLFVDSLHLFNELRKDISTVKVKINTPINRRCTSMCIKINVCVCIHGCVYVGINTRIYLNVGDDFSFQFFSLSVSPGASLYVCVCDINIHL